MNMTREFATGEAVMQIGSKAERVAQGRTERWPRTKEEFVAVVEAYQHRLVQYAFRRLRRLEDAEDVVQEVFIRLYARRGNRPKIVYFSAYLYRMCENACVDVLRKRARAGVSIEGTKTEMIPDGGQHADRKAEVLEEIERVEKLLERLPNRQARVMRLRVFDELRFAEISEIVGCSVSTVKSRFRLGLKKLRPLVKRGQEVPS